MHRTLIGLMILGVLPGCSDREAAKRRQWQKNLEARSGDIQRIEKGYVPHEQQFKGGQWLDLQTHRQDQVAVLIPNLQSLARDADRRQKPGAKSLLADYCLSTARHGARRAIAAWGSVGNESAMLISQMASVGQADRRARSLDIDDTPILATLGEEKQRRDDQLGEYQKLVAEAQRLVDQMNERIVDLGVQKDQTLQQAGDLRKQAFVLKGAEQMALYRRETDLQIQAARFEKQVQDLRLKRDLVQSSLKIDQQQLELYRSSKKWLTKQIETITQQQMQLRKLHDSALKRKDELAGELQTQFAKVQADYDAQVDKVSDGAVGMAGRAVKEIGNPPRGRGEFMLDKLTAQVTLLHVITQQVVIAGSYGRTLDLLARQAQRLELSSANSLRETADQVRRKQRELAAKAEEVAADANETGRHLEGDRDEQVTKAATAQRSHISTYQDRIKAASLDQE